MSAKPSHVGFDPAASAADFGSLIVFAKRNDVTQVILAGELPTVRYGNASSGGSRQTERMYRYVQKILDEFPREGDARPNQALLNYREYFAQHADVLKAEIVRWKSDRKQQQRTLSNVLWYVADQIWAAEGATSEGESAFIEWNATKQPMLRFGLLTLGKLLCTEADVEMLSK